MKKVLINVEERELRVAILEDEQLVELYIESLDEKSIINNIYKGRIEGILPGLKAAFVNIGLEKNAFLHFDDIRPDLLWSKYREMNPELADEVPSAREALAAAAAEVQEANLEPEEEESIDSGHPESDTDSDADENTDEARRKRRRGRRGGRKRRRETEDAYTPGMPVGITEDDLDDESEDELETPAAAAASVDTPTRTPSYAPIPTYVQPHAPSPYDDDDDDEEDQGNEYSNEAEQVAAVADIQHEPATASDSSPDDAAQTSEPQQQQPGSGRLTRAERQRMRRERWEQRKQERIAQRQAQATSGGFVAAAVPSPAPAAFVPEPAPVPIPAAAYGTRGGTVEEHEALNPYGRYGKRNKQPVYGSHRNDNIGNVRLPVRPQDYRENQEDFFGPVNRQTTESTYSVWDDRQPDLGPLPGISSIRASVMRSFQRPVSGPTVTQPRQGQGQGHGGQNRKFNRNKNQNRKRRGPGGGGGGGNQGHSGGGSNRGHSMKRRGGNSFYAASADDDFLPADTPENVETTPVKKTTRSRKPKADGAEPAKPKATRARKTAAPAEAPEIDILTPIAPAEEPAPKPRRTRAKAKAEEPAVAETATAPVSTEAPAAPARKRATRTTKSAKPAEEAAPPTHESQPTGDTAEVARTSPSTQAPDATPSTPVTETEAKTRPASDTPADAPADANQTETEQQSRRSRESSSRRRARERRDLMRAQKDAARAARTATASRTTQSVDKSAAETTQQSPQVEPPAAPTATEQSADVVTVTEVTATPFDPSGQPTVAAEQQPNQQDRRSRRERERDRRRDRNRERPARDERPAREARPPREERTPREERAPREERPPREERTDRRGQPISAQQSYRRTRPPQVPEVYNKGDEVLVQVVKEEIGMKGARISTYVSMPGRYLVLLPYPNQEGGVSRKVEDIAERKRLKTLLRDISSDQMAFIIRTAGIFRQESEIMKDVEFLSGEWGTIANRYATAEPASLVYDDHDILYRLARDVFDENIGEIIIDNHVQCEKLKGMLGKLIPELVDKVKIHTGPENIFHKYQVEKQIQKAARRKVWLKSGGYLIIDEAEALTAVDVNTGKSVGKDDQEKLILKTNLEAARATARELKLRDIGGLIVIDFIDMKDMRNRDQVLSELKAQLRKDRSKTSVSAISEFGLVEMTRKRVRRSLRKTLFTDCPYCQGAGVVLNESQIWLQIKHEMIRQLEASHPDILTLIVNPRLRAHIDQNYKEVLRRLEQRYDTEIKVLINDAHHIENFQIEKSDASK